MTHRDDLAPLKPKYGIGDTIWIVETTSREHIIETCPDCLGELEWHVSMPSGEEFPLGCPTCSRGYNPPTGKVSRYGGPVAMIRSTVVTGIDTRSDKIEYHTPNGYRTEDCVAASQQDAAGLVEKEIARLNAWNAAEEKRRREVHCREVNRPHGRISREDLRDACVKYNAADLYRDLTGGRLPKRKKQ